MKDFQADDQLVVQHKKPSFSFCGGGVRQAFSFSWRYVSFGVPDKR